MIRDRYGSAHFFQPKKPGDDSGVICCSRMLDVKSGEILADVCITVVAGRIKSLTQRDLVANTLDNGWYIDVPDGYTVLPGLIDCHVHLQLCPSYVADPRTDWISSSNDLLLQRMIRNSYKALCAGVTTMRDCGAGRSLHATFRRLIDERKFVAPFVLFAGRPLTPRGGHLAWMGREIWGPDDAAIAVKEQWAAGADFIKATASGGMISGAVGMNSVLLSKDELSSLVDQAHELGMRITAHAHSTKAIEAVARGGVDMIEHCSWLGEKGVAYDKEVAELCAESGVIVVPTNAAFYPRDRSKPQWENLLGPKGQRLEVIAQMLDAGISMVTGTDDQEFDTVWHEVSLLVEAGMSTVNALRAATISAAAALGIEPHVGSLEVGKDADIVVVRGDPLCDTKALTKVVMTISKGVVAYHSSESFDIAVEFQNN